VACYHPLSAFRCANGDVVFNELKRYDIVSSLSLPCGRCVGCRLERSRQWANRCVHEAQLHERNCFITLTYDDAHLPRSGSLQYPDFQRFMKRLRKWAAPSSVRFFMGGEYGETTCRPHYHACLFGVDFPDKVYFKTSKSGEKLFTSKILERLWPSGISSIGELTFESAAYVARYCMHKVTGDEAETHYQGRDPEFGHMSLKPGIGQGWIEKFQSDVFPHDYVIARGNKGKPPRFYDRAFGRRDPDGLESVKFARVMSGRTRVEDQTPERLAVREKVAEARLRLFRRNADS